MTRKRQDASLQAKIKMDNAIWQHGRKKAMITECINKLKQTTVADHPDILKAIAILEEERIKLKKQQIF
jgi:hypothetical protein